MKILIPMFQFGKSGGNRVLCKLANNWISQGHDVDFVTYAESPSPYYPTKANIIWINDKMESVKSNCEVTKGKGLVSRIYYLYSFLKMNSKKYDVVLANYNITAIPVWIASRTNNYYYIQAYEPEFCDSRGIKNFALKLIAWSTYLFPLKRVVNAEIYMNYKNIRSKYVIPPGLDLDTYYPKKLSSDNKKEIVVGCIGREEEWKGSQDVAEAVKILHNKGYSVKLKVAFNPVKYDKYELVKPDGDKNLADFYRSLDVLVAPGHIQLGAIHYPVIEAMACNVPVITTGYYPASDKNAFIVPIKSPDKIAGIIETIINDYSIAVDKAENAEKDIQQFDWNSVSSKFINIFSEIQ